MPTGSDALLYTDASALVKLVVDEPESRALRGFLLSGPELCTSVVAAVELTLAARRDQGEPGATLARRVLRELTLIDLSWLVVERASSLGGLRTLDAIQLATALAAAGTLAGFVTYDRRLGEAAHAEGLRVLAPQ